MGSKRTWYGRITQVVNGLRHHKDPETEAWSSSYDVTALVTLGEGVPARDIGRTVTVPMSPERALDWAAELSSHARTARRRAHESGTKVYRAPVGEDVTHYVVRLLRDFAEDTGVQDDDLHAQVLDLVVELLKIAGRDGIDLDWLANKARDLAVEEI